MIKRSDHPVYAGTPLADAIDGALADLEAAKNCMAVLADSLPTWARPYVYGVGRLALRVGIECPDRDSVIQIGDALFPFDPAFVEASSKRYSETEATVCGVRVIAFQVDPERLAE